MRRAATVTVGLLLAWAASSYGSAERVKRAIVETCREEKFPAPIMLAIAERESDFGLTLRDMRGDGGHGHGIFQIDDRFHSEWILSHDWRSTSVSCRYAIKLLRINLRRFKHWQRAVAAYNCGAGNIPQSGSDWDRRTTGRNYSADVFRRAAKFGKEMAS